jgi:hypothetical protein
MAMLCTTTVEEDESDGADGQIGECNLLDDVASEIEIKSGAKAVLSLDVFVSGDYRIDIEGQ